MGQGQVGTASRLGHNSDGLSRPQANTSDDAQPRLPPDFHISEVCFSSPCVRQQSPGFDPMKNYQSPIMLSDVSDSEPMGTPEYLVREVSDKEDNRAGAIAPVMFEVKSPDQAEVTLATIFNRLKLKRKNEIVDCAGGSKWLRGELQNLLMDQAPLATINDRTSVVCRTRSQQGIRRRGKSRSNCHHASDHVSSAIVPMDLVEVVVKQVDVWDTNSDGKGCGGGPITATRSP